MKCGLSKLVNWVKTSLQVTFTMNGKYGVLEYMKRRIEQNGICVVVVAEGAGQVPILIVTSHVLPWLAK